MSLERRGISSSNLIPELSSGGARLPADFPREREKLRPSKTEGRERQGATHGKSWTRRKILGGEESLQKTKKRELTGRGRDQKSEPGASRRKKTLAVGRAEARGRLGNSNGRRGSPRISLKEGCDMKEKKSG